MPLDFAGNLIIEQFRNEQSSSVGAADLKIEREMCQ